MTSNQHDQPRDRIGQYAATTHAEASSVTLGSQPDPVTAAALERRRNHQEQIEGTFTEVAVDSAVAMAAHTRSKFPTAASVVLLVDRDFDYITAKPFEVHDADGNKLASRNYGPHQEAFDDWAGEGDEEDNVHLLAADVAEHGGKLDGILVRTGDDTVSLDIGKALALDPGTVEQPTPGRDELVARRAAITAEIDALDVNDAAGKLRARYPDAATIEARTTGEDDVVWAELRDSHGNLLTAGDTDDPEFFTELDQLNLVPDKYHAKKSPLRHCTADNDQPWVRSYDLDKMTALTAADLMGE
jgi:hypothetical protein